MSIETRTTQHFAPLIGTSPLIETRTEYKVEDDRTLGEKVKDTVKDAAYTVKDAFTPEVKNKDIAKAAYEEQKKEMKHAEKAEKQAEKVAKLRQKQSDQNAEKCARAMNKHGALYSDNVAITRVTEIH